MRTLTNNIEIFAPIEMVFQWFINLDSNYLCWHPETHEEFKWVTQKPVKKGSQFYFIETVYTHRHKILIEVSEYEENSKLSFRSKKITICSNKYSDKFLSVLSSLFRINIEMKRIFKKSDSNSTLLHTTHIFGSDLPILKGIIDWVVCKFIFPAKEHEKHMQEENKNMIYCIENT